MPKMNEQTVYLEDRHVGVTGANGFIGSHICKLLWKRGAIIHAYIYPGTDRKIIAKYITKSKGSIRDIDITNRETLKGKFNEIEYLFQIAGTVAEWTYPIKKIFDINVRGVKNVHLTAKNAGVKRCVHTSSMTANGSCQKPYPAVTNEDAIWDLQQTGAYSVSKYLGDKIAASFNDPGSYETIRIRPHQVLGWGDTGPSAPGALVLQAINTWLPAYINTVTQVVHIEDVAEAHLLAMERGNPGSVYNIACKNPINAYHFLEYACKVAGSKPPAPISIPKGLVKIIAFILEMISTHITHKTPVITRGNAKLMYKNMGTSIEKAEKELGFNPRSWKEAVEDAVRWFQTGYRPVSRIYDR